MDEPYNAVKVASDPSQIKLLDRNEKKEYFELRKALSKLTALEIRFVEGYIKTASAGLAAKLAGSTAKNLDQAGYKMLQREDIMIAIAIAMKKRIEAVGLDTLEVIQKLREIYDAAMQARNFMAANRACELMLKELERANLAKGIETAKGSTNNSISTEDSNQDDLQRVLSIVSKRPNSGESNSNESLN